jgi:hypothetical protein
MKRLILFTLIILTIVSCSNERKDKNQSTKSNSEKLDLKSIVSKWNLAHNERDVALFSKLYSEKVEFYKAYLSKNECIEKKLELFKKYPDFYQQIHGNIEVIEIDSARRKLSFIKKVTINGKTTDYPSYLLINRVGNQTKIFCESDLITDKNLTKKKTTKKKKVISQSFIKGLKNAKEFSFKEASTGYDFKTDFPNNELYPKKIQIFYNQTALDIKAIYTNNIRVRLPYSFDVGYESDGEMRWEKVSNKYVLGQYDFDKDGVDEIVFAVQDTKDLENRIGISVIKYFTPRKSNNVNRIENWELLGEFSTGLLSPCEGTINDKSIRFDRGLRGFYYEWTFVKGKFVDTGDY